MKTFKQIIQEGEKRQERLKSAISDDRILNRLANIANRIDNKTITPEEGYDLYHKEATRIKDIQAKIK